MIVRSVAGIFLATLSSLVFWPAIGRGSSQKHDGPEKATDGEFAIYLSSEDLPLDGSVDLSVVGLFEEPIISVADITSYASEMHVVESVRHRRRRDYPNSISREALGCHRGSGVVT